MNCRICNADSVVLKTLGADRRRQCTGCGARFTTVEVLKDEHRRQLEAVQTVREVAEKLKDAA